MLRSVWEKVFHFCHFMNTWILNLSSIVDVNCAVVDMVQFLFFSFCFSLRLRAKSNKNRNETKHTHIPKINKNIRQHECKIYLMKCKRTFSVSDDQWSLLNTWKMRNTSILLHLINKTYTNAIHDMIIWFPFTNNNNWHRRRWIDLGAGRKWW